MAEISSVTLPNGSSYNLRDKNAAPNNAGIYFGICSTASDVNAKTVTISNITQLYDGLSIRVLFENGFTGEDIYSTLNLNNLGAKIIFTKTNNFLINNILASYSIMDLVYYNNYWYALDKGIAKTNIFGLTALNDDPTSYSILKAASSKSVKTVYDNTVPVYGMGKNFIDNWYFANPVNHRGASSYTTAGYTIDRWAMQGGTVTVTTGGITYSTSTQYQSFYQTIENAATLLGGKTVVISILWNNASLTSTSFTWQSSGSNTWLFSLGSFYVEASPNSIFITRSGSGNATITLNAIKLELGTKQTLCHNEGTDANPVWVLNEIPNYEEELIKCQIAQAASGDAFSHKVVSVNVPNRNLLDNWYFLGTGSQNGTCKYPINQRGQTTYTGSTDICIDRWHLTNSVVTATLQSTGLRVVTANSLSYSAGIQQKIYASNVPNGIYTLSVLTTTGLNTCQATIDANDGNWRGGSSTAGCWVAVRYMSSTGTFDFNITARDATIIAAKFEYGSQQTLCHNEGTAASPVWVLNQLPDFREELAKCQYYFWAPKVYGSSEDHGICYGHAVSATLGQFYIYLPQMMNPSINPSFIGSVPRVWRVNNNTNANASAINSVVVDGNILCLSVTIGTVTVGEGLRLINTRGSIFGVSREI